MRPFWEALESPTGPTEISAVWRAQLGEDYEPLSGFLRLTGRKASGYPCPYPSGLGCPRRIVDHGGDNIVAVCGDSPKRCDRIELSPADILVYEIDLPELCAFIAKALDFEPARPPKPTKGMDDMWSIGACALSSGGDHLPVYLALPRSDEAFRHAVAELMLSTSGAFVLLTPLSHRTDADTIGRIRSRQGFYRTLEDLLSLDDQGRLVAGSSLADELRGDRDPTEVPDTFRRTGEYWEIAFRGKQIRLKDAKGLRCLEVLLQHPGRDFEPIEIEQAVGSRPAPPPTDHPDHDPRVASVDLGPQADKKTLDQCRKRLDDIRAELVEAKANQDRGKSERLLEEEEQVNAYLSNALGLGGRARRLRDPGKRARDRVRAAIRSSRRAILRELPALDEHLTATLKGGAEWSYRPEHSPDWRF